MSWKQKANVIKIFNAFKRNKDRIYENDIEALKNIDEYVNNESKSLTHGNLVYAKLLAIYLIQNSDYHKGVKQAVKTLQFELKKPLDYHLEILTKQLNNIELVEYLKNKEIFSDDEKTSYPKIDYNAIKQNEKELIEKLKNSWSKEIVEKSFYNSANDLLKEIENYL